MKVVAGFLLFPAVMETTAESYELPGHPPMGPVVGQFMTAAPHSIGRAQSLTVARRMMHEHDIRHLPVFDAGSLVGVLSERDIILVESLANTNPTAVQVEEAMTTDVYTVAPRTPLLAVVEAMADRKLGSAVVMDNDRVVGVFTTVDALRVLALHLR